MGAFGSTAARHLPDAELYYINNRKPRAEHVEAIFRVSGRVPELWHADTGVIEPISYRLQGDHTLVPLALEPSDAVFVVFRRPATASAVQVPDDVRTALATLEGPWSLSFQPGHGAPAQAQFDSLHSWSTQENPGIKYFSGTASYHKTLGAPTVWFGKSQRLELDLGNVSKIAQVLVNGHDLGILWKVPYRIDLTSVLHAGINQLEIRITNLWVNRLIGDRQPGATAVTFTTFNPYQADSPLLESGLLGPVTVSAVKSTAH
jgi:hypothetical protein